MKDVITMNTFLRATYRWDIKMYTSGKGHADNYALWTDLCPREYTPP